VIVLLNNVFKRKKGQVFMVTLAIITLILLIVAYVSLSHKYEFRTKDGLIKKVGDLQFELIDKYAEGEAYLFYLDQSAKYSLDLSLYYLAENGGHFTENECGSYNGYQIWKLIDKECYPAYEENFALYYQSYFSQYMMQYDIEDPYFDFEIIFEDGFLNILGSKEEKSILIYREGQEPKEEIPEEVTSAGLIWPTTSTRLSSCYGWRTLEGRRDYHDGIDISVPIGTPVYAVESGTVYKTQTGCQNDKKDRCGSGFGNYVVIKHSNTLFSGYHHLTSVSVTKRQQVKKGQIIGYSGNSGYSFGYHLDFKLYNQEMFVHVKDAAYINPICVYKDIQFSGKSCTC